MSDSPQPLPDRTSEQQLHQRLLDGDPIAPADLANAYFDRLFSWLRGRSGRRVLDDWCGEAAGEALVSLIKNPASYKPDRLGLFKYLQMSAQRDLQNILAREKKHHQGRVPITDVELSPQAGKYLGRRDDPSMCLRLREEEQALDQSVPAAIRDGLTDSDARVLKLMQRGVRKTSEYAEAYGISHLPRAVQRREIKKVKDRLKTRLKRAKGKDDAT